MKTSLIHLINLFTGCLRVTCVFPVNNGFGVVIPIADPLCACGTGPRMFVSPLSDWKHSVSHHQFNKQCS